MAPMHSVMRGCTSSLEYDVFANHRCSCRYKSKINTNEIIGGYMDVEKALCYVGEAWEDQNYRMNSYTSVGPEGLDVNIFFTSRIVGVVNIVVVDDACHQVEVSKGLPGVRCMHRCLSSLSMKEEFTFEAMIFRLVRVGAV